MRRGVGGGGSNYAPTFFTFTQNSSSHASSKLMSSLRNDDRSVGMHRLSGRIIPIWQPDIRLSTSRAGNSLIGFLSELLVFGEKMSEWGFAQRNEQFDHFRWATWAIRSWSLIFGEQPERIAHGCSFLVSDLTDSLTSLIFGEPPEWFTHIAHQKRGNEQITNFFNKKTYIKHTKKKI